MAKAEIDEHLEQLCVKIEQCITIMRQEPDKYFVHPGKDFTRLRKISLRDLMLFYIFRSGGSIHKELRIYYENKYKDRERPSASAFVQQSNKLKPEAFTLLASIYGENIKSEKKYHGYNLWAVDGTDLTVAGNKSEETHIKINQYCHGNIIHNNLIYDLFNKRYVNYFYQPKKSSNEVDALLQMLRSTTIDNKTILTADRGYPSYNLFAHLNETPNLKYVVRVKNDGFKFVKELPKCELDTDFETTVVTKQTYYYKPGYTVIQKRKGKVKKNGKPYSDKTIDAQWDFGENYPLKIRVVRVEYRPGDYETLFTNLSREEFDRDQIKDIYAKRWGIESSFRQLKYSTGMMATNSKTAFNQQKEILAKIIAFNFMMSAVNAIQIPQNPNNKLVYQINYTNFVDTFKDYFNGLIDAEEFDREVRRELVPVRSERKIKRPKQIVPKGYYSVMYRLAA